MSWLPITEPAEEIMFSDFDNSAKKNKGASFGVSAGISLVVFAALEPIAAAVATARAGPQQQADVEFVQRAPEPELKRRSNLLLRLRPPPRRRRARSAPRPAASSDPMQAPDSIPDEQPDEAEGELIEAGDTGP